MSRGTRRWSSNIALCPFYKATEFQCLFCYGTDHSSIRLSFRDKVKRKAYEEKYCDTEFTECAVYMALAEKTTE